MKTAKALIVHYSDRILANRLREMLEDYHIMEADNVDQSKICLDIGGDKVQAAIVDMSSEQAWSLLEYLKSYNDVQERRFKIYAIMPERSAARSETSPFRETEKSESALARELGVEAVMQKTSGIENLTLLIETFLTI